MAKRFRLPAAGEQVDPAFMTRLAQIERMSTRLDSQYRLPWTRIRFGIDPIVSFVPIVGDLAMAAVSLRLVAQSHSLGAGGSVVTQMVLNVILDTLLGMIPFAGPVMDVFYRANDRNFRLLLDVIERERKRPRG